MEDLDADRSSVRSALVFAIQQGYQVGSAAVELMRELDTRRSRAKLEPIDFMVIMSAVIEKKDKSSAEHPIDRNLNTVTCEDLLETAPAVFERQDGVVVSKESTAEGSDIQVLFDPTVSIERSGSQDFSFLFKSRYEKLLRIFQERPEARQLSKLSDVRKEGSRLRICALVMSRRQRKSSAEVVIDDPTGKVTAFAVSDDVREAVKDVALDQGVLVEVENKKGRILIRSVVQPDLPLRVPGCSTKEAYAIFVSDIHMGSNRFLSAAFSRFLDWLNGKGSRAERDTEILVHLKYVLIGGDIVDGVGVFPNQEAELVETDIVKQYEMVAEKLADVPRRFTVLAIPGNHDSTRQALPQPAIDMKYAHALGVLQNVTLLGDPCVVKLSGVKVLIYHGKSLDDVFATTAGLSYQRPTEGMKVLLKARHLAPTFGSRTPIAPEREDRLVIEEPPDIFHAGHVHTVGIEKYRGTLMINSGTWQAQTSYQANLGIMPSPGVVPIVNLRTLEVTTREFLVS